MESQIESQVLKKTLKERLYIACIANLMGFLEKKRCRPIFYATGILLLYLCVIFFVEFYMYLNELSSAESTMDMESTRLPQEFFTKGDFITFYQ